MLKVRKKIYDYAYCLTPRYANQEKHAALSLFIFKRISMEWQAVPAAARARYPLINLFEEWGKAKQKRDEAKEEEFAIKIEEFVIPEDDCIFYGEMIKRIASFLPIDKALEVLKGGWLAITIKYPRLLNRVFYLMSTYNNASQEHLLELTEYYQKYTCYAELKYVKEYEKLYLTSGISNFFYYSKVMAILVNKLKEKPLYEKHVVILILELLLKKEECFEIIDKAEEMNVEKLPPTRELYKWQHKVLALSTCFVWPIINIICCFDVYEACAYIQMGEDVYDSIKNKIEQGINWLQHVSENASVAREQATIYS
jgi:hypothetical protein